MIGLLLCLERVDFMKSIIFRLLAGLIYCTTVVQLGQTEDLKLCRSPYALTSPNFKYGEYTKQTKDVGPYTVVWLWNTFGNKLENARQELAREQVTGVELALFNTTCVRNQKCGSYETLAGYTINSLNAAIKADNAKLKAKLITESQRAKDWLVANLPAGKECKINPFLEHNMPRDVYQKATNWIKPVFEDRCPFVWNPVGGNPGNAQAPATISEGHGGSPTLKGNCIANPDGTEISSADYPSYLIKYSRLCAYACAWASNDNCRVVGGAFVDPRKRTCSETSDFKRLRNVMIAAQKASASLPPWTAEDEKGTVGCETFLDINDGYKKGFLWKQSDPPIQGRGAVAFLPEKYKDLKIDLSKIYAMKGPKKLESAYTRGIYSEDKSNRQYWRYHTKAENFPYNIVQHFGKICARIPNPKVRND